VASDSQGRQIHGKSEHEPGTSFEIMCAVTNFLILLFVLAGVGVYLMTAEERTRLFAGASVDAKYVWGHVWHFVGLQSLAGDPFCERLRGRAPRLIATPTLLAAHLIVFIIAGWGSQLPTRAANSGATLLLTSMLVHGGFFQLLVNMVVLFQLGFILERLVGAVTFAVVYFSAGLFAAMVGWSATPSGANVGASGAIFGLVGLMIASTIWLVRNVDGLKIPLTVLKALAPAVGVFLVWNLFTGSLGTAAELTGCAVGIVASVVLTKDMNAGAPAARPLSIWSAVTLIVVAVYALLPHVAARQQTDVRPEIERVLALENSTAGAYEHAVDRFRKGRMSAVALAGVIEQDILPSIESASARLKSLDHVPAQHQPFLASALEYLSLRNQSWRLRADALHKADMTELRQADQVERVSLEAFKKVRPPERE
jgi:membrane associated rhomboid family serine protease